ncbi:uncharacterized protein [Amphiura filiformis]|uniref:uncharacterized protein n=1 Tax=Amphiura filiformis TaxID=82378 RepID=UPI003B2140B5
MTMWTLCSTNLMLLNPTAPASLFDKNSATCETPSAATNVQLDLGNIFEVKAVLISSVKTALANAEVLIGNCDHNQAPVTEATIDLNTPCGTITAAEADGMDYWILKDCSVTGQFVYIKNADLMNAICEMEIWGISSTTPQLRFAQVQYSELESVTTRTFTVERIGDSSSCAYFSKYAPIMATF